MKLSSLVDPGERPGEAVVDQRGEHTLATPRRLAGSRRRRGRGRSAPPRASDVVDGQRCEPAQVDDARGDVRALEAAGDPQAHPQAVAERDDGQVGAVAVGAGPADRQWSTPPESGTAPATAHRRRRADRGCGTARWAPGTRTPRRRSARRPRTCASSPRRRRGAPARRSPGRGCRAVRRSGCRCGSARRTPSGSRIRRSAPPSGCGTGGRRRTAASRLRRGSGRRRCAGRPGTGSRGSAAVPTPPRPARGRGWTARRAACRTPAPTPAFFCSPRVTP